MTIPRTDDEADADDLVVRAKTDLDEVGELYDRYFPIIWRYCRRRQLDASTADD